MTDAPNASSARAAERRLLLELMSRLVLGREPKLAPDRLEHRLLFGQAADSSVALPSSATSL
jgi:hypothetical protein